MNKATTIEQMTVGALTRQIDQTLTEAAAIFTNEKPAKVDSGDTVAKAVGGMIYLEEQLQAILQMITAAKVVSRL